MHHYYELLVSQNQGPLKVTNGGLLWKTSNGGKSVEIKKDGKRAFGSTNLELSPHFSHILVYDFCRR